MRIEEYNKPEKILKSGFTTGTCATAATKAAFFLLHGYDIEIVRVKLPIGIELSIPIENIQMGEGYVSCAVRKYAGDDPDITDGIYIYARVEYKKKMQQIKIENKDRDIEYILNQEGRRVKKSQKSNPLKIDLQAGVGIGIVTQKGLYQSIGEPAINPIPKKMICAHLQEAAMELGITGEMMVTIYAPEGVEIAKKTLNSKLGIQGGISILGTTGLVTPMSTKALIDTIRVDIKYHLAREEKGRIIAVPGAYGIRFLKENFGIQSEQLVEFSNYIGEMIDIAVQEGAKAVLICGHLGKLVKLAGGIMNTHSNDADARMELIVAHLIKSTKNQKREDQILKIASQILECNTTSQATQILEREGILYRVMESLGNAMLYYAIQRAEKARNFAIKSNPQRNISQMQIGIISYTLEEGILLQAGEVKKILQ